MRLASLLLLLVISACATPAQQRTNQLTPAQAASITFATISVNPENAFYAGKAESKKAIIGADLTAALQQQFAARATGEGSNLSVTLERLNIVNSGTTAFGLGQSALTGSVEILSAEGELLATYDITVQSGVSSGNLLGALITSAANSSEGYYRSLIERFSERAFERVTE